MLNYIVNRLFQGAIVVVLVSILTFIVMQAVPGSPVDLMIGKQKVSIEQRKAIEHKWGFDRPWYEQYFTWVGNLATGNMGESVVRTGEPVSSMIKNAALMTLRLNVLSFFISIAIAIPVGMLAAIKRYSWFDYGSMLGATIGVTIPNYWIALMGIVLFSVKLGWLPPYGADSWKSYILPVFVLAFEEIAALARLTRGATMEVLGQDYVTTARAKGLKEQVVISRHVLRNALLPIITVIGYRIAFILSGTIVVETVFGWPGIGLLAFKALFARDLNLLLGIFFVAACLVIVVNIIVDVIYTLLDPRIRLR